MATPPKPPTDGTAKPPAPRKPATPRKTGTRKPATTAKAAAKKPATAARAAAKPATPASSVSKPAAPARKPAAKRAAPSRKVAVVSGAGKKWGIAAAIGGIGAALTAGLLALRGSTPASDEVKPNAGEGAHQADGTDSSASFQAGIADEGTIPD